MLRGVRLATTDQSNAPGGDETTYNCIKDISGTPVIWDECELLLNFCEALKDRGRLAVNGRETLPSGLNGSEGLKTRLHECKVYDKNSNLGTLSHVQEVNMILSQCHHRAGISTILSKGGCLYVLPSKGCPVCLSQSAHIELIQLGVR